MNTFTAHSSDDLSDIHLSGTQHQLRAQLNWTELNSTQLNWTQLDPTNLLCLSAHVLCTLHFALYDAMYTVMLKAHTRIYIHTYSHLDLHL